MSIGNYFCFYRSVFKICQCFTATYCPPSWVTWVQGHQAGCNKSLVESMWLIFIFLFAGWGEHHGKQGWLQAGEDMCGQSRKSGAFRDSAQNGLQSSLGIHMKNYTDIHFTILCKDIYIYIKYNIYFWQQTWMPENLATTKKKNIAL
jgi:hypothetical protein